MAAIPQSERLLPEVPLLGQMTQEGAHPGNGDLENGRDSNDSTLDPPQRRRAWSSQGFKTTLSPSPTLIETRRLSKDDSDVNPNPVTPKRPGFATRAGSGLSLQMPPRDISSTSIANLTTKRVPLSPKPDAAAAFTSPTSVLPRRSRGMEFSRAATNLHHSTLPEQSSPESSPTVGGRRGMMIPPRKGLFTSTQGASITDSPGLNINSLWTGFPPAEKSTLSSSVPSSIMMDDDTGSSSSDQDELMDYGEDEDTIHMTPQVNGIGLTNPFGSLASSPSVEASAGFSATAAKLLSYQRARVQSRRSRARNSSSRAGGPNSLQSPGQTTPPLTRTTTDGNVNPPGTYFLDEPTRNEIKSRRESLSLGTNDMRLSDAEQSEDEGSLHTSPHESFPTPTPVTPSMEERKEVVRRAVTRRGNLLPKSKNFARIRAALLEEGAPVDTEVRREAEVIRQVREGDGDQDVNLQPSQPASAAPSPSLGPITSGPAESASSAIDDTSLESEGSSTRRSSSAFSTQAIKNSAGINFWNNFDERMRTPPPILVPRSNSSGVSEDMNMETPQSSVWSVTAYQTNSKVDEQPAALQTSTVQRKGNKRMRDDDFDPNYFKRRAVSPGLSVQNSPVLPQSPGWWGTQARTNRETSSVPGNGERSASNGSAGSISTGCGLKRIGFQGVNDTNDGIMNMTIE